MYVVPHYTVITWSITYTARLMRESIKTLAQSSLFGSKPQFPCSKQARQAGRQAGGQAGGQANNSLQLLRSRSALACPGLSCPVLSCPVLPCLALPCLALPCLAMVFFPTSNYQACMHADVMISARHIKCHEQLHTT